LETLKKVLTLAVALAVVSSGYLCEVNGAAEPITKKAPSISEFTIISFFSKNFSYFLNYLLL